MAYVGAPETCHGLTFRTAFFFVEDLSDLFYTMFPIIVAYTDTYNANAGELLVLLGQFHVDDFMAFASRFFFLATLCCKTHHLVYSAHANLMNRYYAEFNLEDDRPNWIEDDDPQRSKKRCFLFTISALYVVLAVTEFVMVSTHFNQAEQYCNLIKEANFNVNGNFHPDSELSEEQKLLFETNPELFLWDNCLHQVLPFTGNEKQQCQCRVFVIDVRNLESYDDRIGFESHLGLSENVLMQGTFQNNIMLEKLRFVGAYSVLPEAELEFHPSMFKATHLKAIQFDGLIGPGFGDYMYLWTELEYLEVELPYHFGDFQSFGHLLKLKHLQVDILTGYGATTLPHPEIPQENITLVVESLCSLKNLQFLTVFGPVESIPHCFGNLRELRILSFLNGFALTRIPFSILDLPQLKMLDLFKGLISLESLLKYNLPQDITTDDVSEIYSWLDTHFSFNENADFYFQLNPICDGIASVGTGKLHELLEVSCNYACSGTKHDALCAPRFIGDGVCDTYCNSLDCNYDGGDWYVRCIYFAIK